MALSYSNQKGQRYYLCETHTQSGKPRLVFSRAITGKPLDAVPAGYEIAESIHGVVSLRKIMPSLISEAEVQEVRAALGSFPHLKHYRVEVKGKALIVYEPVTVPEETILSTLKRK